MYLKNPGVELVEQFTADGFEWRTPNVSSQAIGTIDPVFRFFLVEEREVYLEDICVQLIKRFAANHFLRRQVGKLVIVNVQYIE